MKGARVGCIMTGSFCTFAQAFEAFGALARAGARLTPIMSDSAYDTDTRFYTALAARREFERIAGREPMHTICEAEPIGPMRLVDIMIVAPCTGNTMAKIANGIIDTPAAMAVKSAVRGGAPVLLAVSSNDALGIGARNLGALLSMRDIFFVPFRQDDPINKPRSLVARFDLLPEAAKLALERRQLQPLLADNCAGE